MCLVLLKFSLTLDQTYIGNTVNIMGLKMVNDGLTQIKIQILSNIQIVDKTTSVP